MTRDALDLLLEKGFTLDYLKSLSLKTTGLELEIIDEIPDDEPIAWVGTIHPMREGAEPFGKCTYCQRDVYGAKAPPAKAIIYCILCMKHIPKDTEE